MQFLVGLKYLVLLCKKKAKTHRMESLPAILDACADLYGAHFFDCALRSLKLVKTEFEIATVRMEDLIW